MKYFLITEDRQVTPLELFKYYSSSVEFDAYSKQITEHVKCHINNNPKSKQTIVDWLKSPLSYLPPELIVYDNAFINWNKADKINHTKYIRTFKVRLYNELFNERK